MFERLRRALYGPPSVSAAPVVPSEPGRLDWITRTTPYRFRTWLADPSQRAAVPGILQLLIDRELTIEFVDEPVGRVRLDMVSTFEGWAAVTRPLSTLRRGGVRVRGLERLDLFDDVAPDELERLVRDWETRAYDTAARRRMDALAGEATLGFAIEARHRQPTVRAWLSVAASAANNTPGIDALLLESAASEPDADLAATLASAVAGRVGIAELVSEPFEPPGDLVLAVARRRDKAAEAAYRIADSMSAPLDGELTAVLCKAARRKGPARRRPYARCGTRARRRRYGARSRRRSSPPTPKFADSRSTRSVPSSGLARVRTGRPGSRLRRHRSAWRRRT
jgi:hypothetical protein